MAMTPTMITSGFMSLQRANFYGEMASIRERHSVERLMSTVRKMACIQKMNCSVLPVSINLGHLRPR